MSNDIRKKSFLLYVSFYRLIFLVINVSLYEVILARSRLRTSPMGSLERFDCAIHLTFSFMMFNACC